MKLIMESWKKFMNEGLDSSLFLKAREAAELDILSYFEQPSSEESEESMHQRQMPDTKNPEIWELRNYLVWDKDKRTSGMDLSAFREAPVPDEWVEKLASPNKLDPAFVRRAHERGDKRWPLDGVDLTNYMVYWMANNGTLTRFNDGKVAATPKGAKRFHELMGSKQADFPDTMQGGEAAKFDYDPMSSKPKGRKFDKSNWDKGGEDSA